ncbi:MAG: TrkH family potassium uptake protein, partial [Oscillospiraceae bacterium]|nr:TrkH family potassium uptake protein [Oscillospiraceae bacterium]
MNYRMIINIIAKIAVVEAVFMLPALAISAFSGEVGATRGFLLSLAIMAALSGILFGLCRKAGKLFGAREGLVCVGISWVVLSLLGCLPFWFSREIP